MMALVIDSDCALGSRFGDVDDAFAVIYSLLVTREPVQMTAVAGNASFAEVRRNLTTVAHWLDRPGPVAMLPSTPCEVLTLGPLSNVAAWLDHGVGIEHVWLTLGRWRTRGRWPPFWPMEFNATKDLGAFFRVLRSPVPCTVVPLDVASRLRADDSVWKGLDESRLGRLLRAGSRRWRSRSWLLKGRGDFPVWDLVAAIARHRPEFCRFEDREVKVWSNGLMICGPDDRGGASQVRRARVLTEFSPEKFWAEFFAVIEAEAQR
jgi:inosine-uridine nucleoside N-ribohydrolase